MYGIGIESVATSRVRVRARMQDRDDCDQGKKMLKLADNPPVLSPWVARLRDLAGRWWVAHTKARFEKAFAWDLVNLGIGHFLPMVDRVRISGGKRRHAKIPLFSSYVFICGNSE